MMIENENDLKALITKYLSSDFDLVTEVTGKNLVDSDQRIRVDFLAKAKHHIIDFGFSPDWFGIEVKFIKPDKHTQGQINKVFWQAVTYSQSLFKVGSPPFVEEIRPRFVFVLINTQAIKDNRAIGYVLAFCQYSNVGQLIISNLGYSFRFGAGMYFSKRNDEYQMSQVINIGEKRYVGNVNGSKTRE